MAIDDNTSYELTGAQVKDLASKINAKADSSSLATVATSGLYSDLSGTPTIPTKTSDLTNDGADNTSTYVEADELATVATSGSYADLSNKPTIPTVNDATLTITQNGTSAGTFTANASSNTTIALTDTTYSAMTGATSGTAGTSGLVPAPAAGDQGKFLQGDGTWATPNAGGVFNCYVNKTLSDPWTGFWGIYDSTSYTTQLDSLEISAQLLAGKRVVVYTSDSSPYTFEIISQYDDSVPCYDFIVSFNGVLKRLHYVKLAGWNFGGDIVNDATLTIQHNGTTVDTFTANASANKTVNIETIWADDIEATTPVPAVETAMIADGAVTSAKIADGTIATGDIANSAVTNAKIDWSTVTSSYVSITKNASYVGNIEAITVRSLGNGLVFVSIIFKLSANVTAGSNVTVFSGLPGTPLGYYDILGLDASVGKPVRFRVSGSSSAHLNIAWDALAHGASSDITVSFVYPTK